MELQAFNFNGTQIRTIEKGGQPWFVLKDVCEILDLAHRVVRQRLTDDVCSTYPVFDALGRPQETTIINEDGLYDVILESRKPEARTFRKWVTSEVLPSIRQHGGYLTPEKIEEVLLNPDTIIDLAQRLKQANEEKAKLAAKIEADKPKVLFAEALETSSNSILIGELAKLLKQNGVNIGQNRLFERLRNEGYLMKTKDERWNDPTQKALELGLFEIKKRTINGPDGTVRTVKTTKVTGKGQIYFINKYKAGAVS
ncbi:MULTISPECIES: phage antirepressor Ant [Brevibacillus]|uniref:phage antirepressor Ant n=1 Tax=Brevibacillus TaxID=55080 RepID=UPI0002A4EBFE|nr:MULTISPECIES: phage antirepressor Ant [Brevibacillus]ELK38990.1 phage antirepressor protein [Brevibacillus agri BAB-2500]MBY0054101.1 phage antirepressor Ant [Brevibacillus agri]MCM3589653.1 phage antirepressor Ant [Brevibacillus borstelensis]